ncbi:MAG: hypothetical protein R3A13_04535 [Bdellovibrionota bacterium]
MEARKLYLKQGYSSLFVYLITELHYVVEKESFSLLPLKQNESLKITFAGEVETTSSASSRLNLSFSVKAETQDLMDEAKELLSGKFPKGASLEELFIAGLNALVAEKKRKAKALGSRASKNTETRTRHIPNKIRKAVLESVLS